LTEIQEKPAQKRQPVLFVITCFLLLAGLIALVAAGYSRSKSDTIALGQEQPDFSLTTFDGQVIRPAGYSDTVVVLNFWASWCQPCEEEAAGLEKAWQHYKPGGKVLFLGIDYVDTESPAQRFLQKYGVTYPNGPDLGTRIASAFRVRGVPETYIFNRDGRLAYYIKGPFNSADEIIKIIDPLVAQE
jgi:cytochrome c biogenesis protein CcmG, thiol:disulfide interchange protein DsbE